MVFAENENNKIHLNAIIVEDELKAQRILNALISEHCENITVLDTVGDIPSAVKSIVANKPDVVFLDIELPGYSGFELVDFFENPEFEIIFTTAYSEYAIRAFELSAIDYILKPIQIDKLQNAIEKARREKGLQLLEKFQTLKSNLLENQNKKIALPLAEGYMFVEQNEIIYFEADNVYTTIYLVNGNKFLVSRPIKEFVGMIDSPDFVKPHRSYFINLNHIKQYIKQDGGHLIMQNGDIVYIARDKKQEFLQLLQERGLLK